MYAFVCNYVAERTILNNFITAFTRDRTPDLWLSKSNAQLMEQIKCFL